MNELCAMNDKLLKSWMRSEGVNELICDILGNDYKQVSIKIIITFIQCMGRSFKR